MIFSSSLYVKRAGRRVGVGLSLVFAIVLARWAAAQSLAPRPAVLQWDASAEQLMLSVSYRDVADAELLRKLRVGLPTTLVMTALLYPVGQETPVASTGQTCKITWHVWDELYLVEVRRAGDLKASRHYSATLEGVLRRCAEARQLLLARAPQVPPNSPLVVRMKVLINPVNAELLARLRRWITRPSSTESASPGSVLFSTFSGFFMARVGEAERVLQFETTPTLPRFHRVDEQQAE